VKVLSLFSGIGGLDKFWLTAAALPYVEAEDPMEGRTP
jgi:site-specific DNA-cytosine methylase